MDQVSESKSSRTNGPIVNFDHIRFWVGNAKQAAYWHCMNFGFEPFVYKGLETGSRNVVSHVVRQKKILFVFESALLPGNEQIGAHLKQHGDSVKDVAFEVHNLDAVLEHAQKSGAKVVCDLWEEEDEGGKVRMATLQTYGDTLHTLVDRSSYKGLFLPGYKPDEHRPPVLKIMPLTCLDFIDHVVGNQSMLQMKPIVNWYVEMLSLNRLKSGEESLVMTDYSGLRYTVVGNKEQTVKMPITEPVKAKYKAVSQVQEFVDYNGGPGVQHIALHTSDIIRTVEALRERGMTFVQPPSTYYEQLKERLGSAKVVVQESIDKLKQNSILIDYDDHGYLLQIFTKPIQDRPTLFIEIIQRRNHQGFGAGNFKALFESIELEQRCRGNLIIDEED